MATYQVTIVDYLGVFGERNQSLFGSAIFGTAVFGSVDELVQRGAQIYNSFSLSESITGLSQTSGPWYRLFRGGSTNPNSATTSTYSFDPTITSIYQSPSHPSTTWS